MFQENSIQSRVTDRELLGPVVQGSQPTGNVHQWQSHPSNINRERSGALESIRHGIPVAAPFFDRLNLSFIVGNRVERTFGQAVAFSPETSGPKFRIAKSRRISTVKWVTARIVIRRSSHGRKWISRQELPGRWVIHPLPQVLQAALGVRVLTGEAERRGLRAAAPGEHAVSAIGELAGRGTRGAREHTGAA